MIASQSIGSLAALPLAIWLPDRFGRKMSIYAGNVIIIAGAVGQTFTNGYAGAHGSVKQETVTKHYQIRSLHRHTLHYWIWSGHSGQRSAFAGDRAGAPSHVRSNRQLLQRLLLCRQHHCSERGIHAAPSSASLTIPSVLDRLWNTSPSQLMVLAIAHTLPMRSGAHPACDVDPMSRESSIVSVLVPVQPHALD